jgi:hypothetical protein
MSVDNERADDPLRWLPATSLATIDAAKRAIERALGDTCVSIAVIGAALNPARGDRAQSPELLAVVKRDYFTKMPALAEALAPSMRAGVRVRVLTEEELERAADVFALEFAEWKARHRVLSGIDPFANSDVTPEHLRHAIELELRSLSRRVRNRVLAGIAVGPRRDDPSRAIRDGVDRLMVAIHHLLVLTEQRAVGEESAMLDAIERRCSVDVGPLRGVLASVRAANNPPKPMEALGALLSVSDAIAQWIDRWEVSP